jgi:hypothetical protein
MYGAGGFKQMRHDAPQMVRHSSGQRDTTDKIFVIVIGVQPSKLPQPPPTAFARLRDSSTI